MIDSLALALSGLGLAASIIYYATVIQNQNKARQRELVFQRLSQYSLEYTKAFADIRKQTDWKTYEEWNQKYGPDINPEAWSNYLYITRIYNLAGIMLQERATDAELIFKLFDPVAFIRVWEQFSPIIQHNRMTSNHEKFYEPFEYIYNEAKRRYPNITKIT